ALAHDLGAMATEASEANQAGAQAAPTAEGRLGLPGGTAGRKSSPPAAPTAEGRLVLVDHERVGLPAGTAFTLRSGTVVGREADADIALGDNFVSGEHARLSQEPGGWWVIDLDATNGTFVNGARIERPTLLKAG